MTVPLLVLTNGRRDCISRTIPSAIKHLKGVACMVIVDASHDATYGDWLAREFIGGPFDGKVLHLPGEPGYWRAMQAVWDYACYLLDYMDVDKAVLLEDDFLFNGDVDLADMAAVLDAHPYLTQIALVRQPWWGNEYEHGGVVGALEAQGQTFTERTDGTHHWLEHRAGFTCNPTLIPRSTFDQEWPEGAWSESRFGRRLFADPEARGAYWGRRDDTPRVEHIGHQRVGSEY